MILRAGPERAVSFTDDTSLDTRNKKKRYVSIQAKVRRDNPLDWFYDLIRPFEKEKGELESEKVLQIYRSLSPARRIKLWDTLKEVQVNISDSLPYQEETAQSAKRALQRDDAIDYIRQRAIANDPHAKWLQEQLNNQTAESILFDAPSRYLSYLSFYARNPFAGFGLRYTDDFDLAFPRPPKHDIPLSNFKSAKPGSIVRTVTKWTAMSASVFSDAIDNVSFTGFYPSHPLLDPVYRALCKSHAFDGGNEKLVDLTDDERRNVAHLIQFNNPYGPTRNLSSQPRGWFEPLYNVDSRRSFYTQASDIANAIAKSLYELGGILAVTKHFEYVMFNGKRTTQSDAYEINKKWNELGYFN